jgi:hypothetical protein
LSLFSNVLISLLMACFKENSSASVVGRVKSGDHFSNAPWRARDIRFPNASSEMRSFTARCWFLNLAMRLTKANGWCHMHFRSAWIPARTQSLSKLSSNVTSEVSVNKASLLNQLCLSRYLYLACRYFSLFLRFRDCRIRREGGVKPGDKTVSLHDYATFGLTAERLMVQPDKWNHPEYDGFILWKMNFREIVLLPGMHLKPFLIAARSISLLHSFGNYPWDPNTPSTSPLSHLCSWSQ